MLIHRSEEERSEYVALSLSRHHLCSRRRWFWLATYLLFGALHELSHVVTAIVMGYDVDISSLSSLFGLLFGRTTILSSLEEANEFDVAVVRHAGWVFSFLLHVLLSSTFVDRQVSVLDRDRTFSFFLKIAQNAAFVTLLEALTSDLLVGLSWSAKRFKTVFCCGNFGVIVLNDAWVKTPGDNGKTVLDLLEKMASITMMRGAQTGGIVAWTHRQGKAPIPVRVRVVNGKRTDLSKKMRKAINSKVCMGWGGTGSMDKSVRLLLGHTRFATSSKATLDGTHPHCWCPPQFRRVFPLDNPRVCTSKTPRPIHMKVANFITHNGDLDFYKVNEQHSPLQDIQDWLVEATGFPMPAPVDSAAIAGLVDIIRCAGCFALSIRYAHLLGMSHSGINTKDRGRSALPSYMDYDRLSHFFESTLIEYCMLTEGACLQKIAKKRTFRNELAERVASKIKSSYKIELSAFRMYAEPTNEEVDDDEDSMIYKGKNDVEQQAEQKRSKRPALLKLCQKTIDAFFDNDLDLTTRIFMKNAVGSFGLMVTSSLDSHRQISIAARGQPMSVAFYPSKGIVCYGSELAAVKAGMQFERPGGDLPSCSTHGGDSVMLSRQMTQQTCRFDLDDLSGEVALLDWSSGLCDLRSHRGSRSCGQSFRSRITPLRDNEFLLPLTPDCFDPIGEDICSIPRALNHIQERWKEGGLNRLTAWNLGRKIRERLTAQAAGRSKTGSVDILLTGCEVSLWVAEQFASDLAKSFPKLDIQAISSNKLLGLMGQELSVPSIGFPMSHRIPDLKNAIVIIVSHSGETFAPLAVSNLLQSVTCNIFVVASEWDSQIGKQLRATFDAKGMFHDEDFFGSRVFTTDIGIRPSEPCSLSVAATHQLLTQIFEYICLVILSNQTFRDLTGAVITEPDLRVLERCNQDNILALERIVGREVSGKQHPTEVQRELKDAGTLWADHVLEQARAYIMSFIYVVGTVTAGCPAITGFAILSGLVDGHYAFYITRFLDALIYFFLPQINIIIIRLIQKRNLLHRMSSRTVVIGDIPWVSQSIDAFLSKIFARSYSIASLNVLSGNPADHLVHRHTHRVVRGTLLVCGRPDGRLTALTSAECAVNLSVNQASSIQSLGSTCESITIGHNPSGLGLTKMDIALSTHRPKFLCEQILDVVDDKLFRKQQAQVVRVKNFGKAEETSAWHKWSSKLNSWIRLSRLFSTNDDGYITPLDRSSHSLKGAYLGMRQHSERLRKKSSKRVLSAKDFSFTGSNSHSDNNEQSSDVNVSKEMDLFEEQLDETSAEEAILASMIAEKQKSSQLHQVFSEIDKDGSGTINLEEFMVAYEEVQGGLPREKIEMIFREADLDCSEELDYKEFVKVMTLRGSEMIRHLHHANQRNDQGLLEVKPSTEEYFGAEMYMNAPPGIDAFAQAQSQHFSMELYESRIASLQRFTAMCVMFHQMGKRVQDFFPKYSLGLIGYKMEHTHSIMRIATTASPVSGDAVREQMQLLKTRARFVNAANLIIDRWNALQKERVKKLRRDYSSLLLSVSSHMNLDDSQNSPSSQVNLNDRVRSTSSNNAQVKWADSSGQSTSLLDEMIERDKEDRNVDKAEKKD